MAAASAEALRLLAEYDEAKAWERDGSTSMTGWLAARYGLARATAREWVRVARAVRELPRIARAHACGRLSFDQLKPLTRFAAAETDEYWAARAPSLRPWRLWREAERHQRLRTRQAEGIHRRRYLSLTWDQQEPVLHLQGWLPAEQGAALEGALQRRAQEVAPDPCAQDPEGARLADALVELVGAGGQGEPAATTLVVHASAEALTMREPRRGPWLAETEGGRRLASEAVRRLACDGRVEWVLESGGRPVGIGRQGRVVPGYLSRLLRHRDGGCRFPGCERKRWLKAHHLLHWARGGRTDLENLVLLCHSHHRLLHEGGWRTSGDPASELRFHDRTGRQLVPLRASKPEPVRQPEPALTGAFP